MKKHNTRIVLISTSSNVKVDVRLLNFVVLNTNFGSLWLAALCCVDNTDDSDISKYQAIVSNDLSCA